jgi:uncharacterized damage-inducible protein DinB
MHALRRRRDGRLGPSTRVVTSRAMDAFTILTSFARNNAWANHRLYAACAQLSSSDLHAKRTSFFPTIMKTLCHNLIVDWYYVDALTHGGKGRSVFETEDPFTEIAPLHAAQREVDARLIALTERLRTPADLDENVSLARKDHVQVETAGAVLLHLFEHQIHHRGQVHAMMAGTSVRPPQLDEFFLREELPLRRRELEDLGLPIE